MNERLWWILVYQVDLLLEPNYFITICAPGPWPPVVAMVNVARIARSSLLSVSTLSPSHVLKTHFDTKLGFFCSPKQHPVAAVFDLQPVKACFAEPAPLSQACHPPVPELGSNLTPLPSWTFPVCWSLGLLVEWNPVCRCCEGRRVCRS